MNKKLLDTLSDGQISVLVLLVEGYCKEKNVPFYDKVKDMFPMTGNDEELFLKYAGRRIRESPQNK